MTLVINGLDELRARLGQDLGSSDWRQISQADVDAFAEVTGDHQWIHVDVARAAESPFGGTIAHGYYTLALVPVLQADIFRMEGINHGLNYGVNRVRFPAPLPVGASIRSTVAVQAYEDRADGAQVVYRHTLECDQTDKPVCVAETVVRYFAAEA